MLIGFFTHARTRILAGLFSAAAVAFLLMVSGADTTNAFPHDQFKSPIFDGVRHVYIDVHHVDDGTEQELADLPDALRKPSIEALLLQIYRRRFDSKQCSKNYGCHDQPVNLLPTTSYESRKARQQPATLTVAFRVQILRGDEFKSPLAVLTVVQDRSDPEIPTALEVNPLMAIPLDIPSEEIADRLKNYIENRIY